MLKTQGNRYYRSTRAVLPQCKCGTTYFSGNQQISARTKTKMNITFDSLGQSLRNLKHSFSRRLRTYTNHSFNRSTIKFQPFSRFGKEGSKPSQNANHDPRLARGLWMILMTLDGLPQVTASTINKTTQEKINDLSKDSKSQKREQN